ncbi:hypothetical protein FS842_001619 [Serendipita sp. 407]|nr:hypothetical protein FS842_001619 [Serendipita sp. 407]
MISLTDEYTIALGITAITAYFVSQFLIPPPLVHPLLLGQQSQIAAVRKENESAVYSSYGIGSSPPPISPGRGVVTQPALLKLEAPFDTAERWLWDRKITNAQLHALVNRIGPALCSVAGLVPKGSRVLMLLDDCLEWLVADLALASYCVPTITLASRNLLNEVLDQYTPTSIIVQASFLVQLLEQLEEAHTSPTIVVVGDKSGLVKQWEMKVKSKLVAWEDLGAATRDPPSVIPPNASDISSAHFYSLESGKLRGVQFTHQNVVAGAYAILNAFPTSTPWGEGDMIISAHSLSTPYGRSILYAALYSGANFTTFASSILKETDLTSIGSELLTVSNHELRPSPTLLFLTPEHLRVVTSNVLNLSKKFLLFGVAWRHKHAAILRGYLVRDGLWDRQVFNKARISALGLLTNRLRGVAVGPGPVQQAALLPARIALSIPVMSVYASPLSASPVFASHPLDMQILETSENRDTDSKNAHSGPPTSNVAVKLLRIREESVAVGGDPEGEICIRGPGVGDPIPMNVSLEDGWIPCGVTAKVLANGTFVVGDPIASTRSSMHDFTII